MWPWGMPRPPVGAACACVSCHGIAAPLFLELAALVACFLLLHRWLCSPQQSVDGLFHPSTPLRALGKPSSARRSPPEPVTGSGNAAVRVPPLTPSRVPSTTIPSKWHLFEVAVDKKSPVYMFEQVLPVTHRGFVTGWGRVVRRRARCAGATETRAHTCRIWCLPWLCTVCVGSVTPRDCHVLLIDDDNIVV